MKLLGLSTTFTRVVAEDGVVTVTTDCDDPTMMMLARKGDGDYWSGDTWVKNRKERRMWAAEITRRMLEEGLISTGLHRTGGVSATRAAMSAASTTGNRDRLAPAGMKWDGGPDALTAVVAQIRGLRLIQSMAPAEGWETKLGGHTIPLFTQSLLSDCFTTVDRTYRLLRRPPWDDDVEWGPQLVAGHATNRGGDGAVAIRVFVGEQGDLVWRALTETDNYGMSPLTGSVCQRFDVLNPASKDMIVAAVLYDETAEQQLTTGLFDVTSVQHRRIIRERMLGLFDDALTPLCQWTPEQQERLRGFIEVVETLEP